MSKKDRHSPPPFPEPLTGVFDAHTHLNTIASGGAQYHHFAPTDPIITDIVHRAQSVGVNNLVTVADDLPSALFAASAAQTIPGVYAAVAIHPIHAHTLDQHAQNVIEELIQYPRVVSVGETGLDAYWPDKDDTTADLIQQEESFRWHIELAKKYNKALMIHNREADLDILRILDDQGAPDEVIFHCFSSDAQMARRCMDKGYYMSLSGTVTFKNAHELHEAAKIIPSHLLLVETDAPFLTPHPHRGKPNEPYCLPYTVQCIAQLRDETPQHIAELTSHNAHRVYKTNRSLSYA